MANDSIDEGSVYPDLALSSETTEIDNDSISSVGSLLAAADEDGGTRRNTTSRLQQGSSTAGETSGEYEFLDNRYRSVEELNLSFKKIKSKNPKYPDSFCTGCKTRVYSTDVKRLLRHLKDATCAIDDDTKYEILESVKQKGNYVKVQQAASKEFNLQWAKVMIANNIPFRATECMQLRKFFMKLRPDWVVPSRQEIAQTFIPKLAELGDEKFNGRLTSTDEEFYLSVEFDHWRDGNDRSVLAVVATLPDGRRQLLLLEDVTLRGHSSNSIVKSLRKALKRIPHLKLNAIMSDSASSCKAARRELVDSGTADYPHLIQYRCQAHLLNLIGAKMMEDEDVEALFTSANKLVSFISSNQKLQRMLTELGYKKLVKSTAVRWYSHVAMLESLVEIKDEASRIFTQATRETEKNSLHLRLLNCAVFWEDVPKAINVLRPLADCIAVAERSAGSLGESTKAVLEFAKFLISSDWTDVFVLSGIKSFLHYISEANLGTNELGLMFAAYALDKRFTMNYLTKEGLSLIFDALIDVAARTSYTLDMIHEHLVSEFKNFKEQKGSFSFVADEEKVAAQWWKNQPDVTILKKIALRLAALKSSSANTERLFSTLKLIQSPTRTRFSLSTMEMMAKVKIAMSEGHDTEIFGLLTGGESFIDEDTENDQPLKTKSRKFKDFTKTMFSRVTKMISGRTRALQSSNSQSQLDLLGTAQLRETYEKFIALIDFDIVNTQNSPEPIVSLPDMTDRNEIMKKFKRSL